MQLSNQVAVITGATSGIGLAATATFTREGARVVGFARHSSDDARRAVGTTGEGQGKCNKSRHPRWPPTFV